MVIAAASSSTLLQCEYGLFITAFTALILSLGKCMAKTANFHCVRMKHLFNNNLQVFCFMMVCSSKVNIGIKRTGT